MVRRSFSRSKAPRIRINDEIAKERKEREKERIRVVKEERKRAKENLKKIGVNVDKCKWVDDE